MGSTFSTLHTSSLIVRGATISELVWGVPFPLSVYIIHSVPIIAAFLTPILGLLLGLAWKERYWSLTRRTFNTVVLMIYIIYLLELLYWNLLGFNF